ncbi:GGDEF domain-containing protein [Alkalimarinus alittae]|uniref:diguanylate cyclase n=1 Tax=Alkalimarinus alittae TaxID=2961619 RepID=A0ABY6N0Y0_9ALTE|nr:GGDEF domain-containing protein [Alkalimarinus alittae]UZE95724.1 GGDEF domain-containing protein [Alkalimarinus alittae]
MAHHHDDLTQAVRYLKLTLPEMCRREIPTTPENYAVWYEFTTGTNFELKQKINSLIKNNTPFSEEINTNLYTQYIENGQQIAVDEIRDNVRKIINELLLQVSNEESGLGQYAKSLETFSEKVNDNTDANTISLLITELLTETRKREEATHNLQATLDNMAQEMTNLREEVERLNDEASIDALTRVKNRRAFNIALEKSISASKINSAELALLILDIDHFKQFNDQFGHITGDKVLRFVATILQKNVKGNDTVARFGGEEFAVILPETSYGNALSVAENIRSRIADQMLTDSTANIKLGSVHASIGAATYRYGESPEEFIRRADQCLYKAKRDGRNRVIGEQEITEQPHSNEQKI